MTAVRRWCVVLAAVGALPLVFLAHHRIALQAEQEPADVVVAVPQLPSHPSLPRTAQGRHYPLLRKDPQATAALLGALEAAIRDPAVPVDRIPPLAHQQQVIYRVLSRDPQRAAAVRTALAPRWRWVFDQHIAARREFLAMHRGPATSRVPAWRI